MNTRAATHSVFSNLFGVMALGSMIIFMVILIGGTSFTPEAHDKLLIASFVLAMGNTSFFLIIKN